MGTYFTYVATNGTCDSLFTAAPYFASIKRNLSQSSALPTEFAEAQEKFSFPKIEHTQQPHKEDGLCSISLPTTLTFVSLLQHWWCNQLHTMQHITNGCMCLMTAYRLTT